MTRSVRREGPGSVLSLARDAVRVITQVVSLNGLNARRLISMDAGLFFPSPKTKIKGQKYEIRIKRCACLLKR